MNFIESLKQSFESLKANKLRSILTMLGIIMGVFSVITIIAIGNATQAYIDQSFKSLGANLIQVTYGSNDISEKDRMTEEDIDLLIKSVPEIKNISTSINKGGTLRLNDKDRNASISGVSSQFKELFPVEYVAGRGINNIDVSTRSNVVVVKEDFAKKFYKKSDIIGETIKLKVSSGSIINLKVIGVTKVEESPFGNSFENENSPVALTIPISTVQTYYANSKELNVILLSVTEKNDEKLREITKKIIKTLETKHANKGKYFALSFSDIQGTITKALGIISAVLLVIAVITLIVGGIGIINILLVSVTERIREIGIRKAIGARKSDIVVQFITESIILTGFSGLVGIILGIVAGGIISSLIKIPPVVDVPVIIMAFLGSITLGLVFGVYPAKKAADLDPIESLRYE